VSGRRAHDRQPHTRSAHASLPSGAFIARLRVRLSCLHVAWAQRWHASARQIEPQSAARVPALRHVWDAVYADRHWPSARLRLQPAAVWPRLMGTRLFERRVCSVAGQPDPCLRIVAGWGENVNSARSERGAGLGERARGDTRCHRLAVARMGMGHGRRAMA
jgi:hypothetical protein